MIDSIMIKMMHHNHDCWPRLLTMFWQAFSCFGGPSFVCNNHYNYYTHSNLTAIAFFWLSPNDHNVHTPWLLLSRVTIYTRKQRITKCVWKRNYDTDFDTFGLFVSKVCTQVFHYFMVSIARESNFIFLLFTSTLSSYTMFASFFYHCRLSSKKEKHFPTEEMFNFICKLRSFFPLSQNSMKITRVWESDSLFHLITALTLLSPSNCVPDTGNHKKAHTMPRERKRKKHYEAKFA